ncbi:MAG: 50S ribosomal protein L7/L12 [Clostridia bacterium]|nr:50S ribosomal protein L7/L12 [Clostridia bacterium]
MSKVNELVEQIKTLTVVEVSELVKALEDEFGVSAAAPVAVAAAPVAGAAPAAAEAAAEKATYNVVLKGIKPDASKVGVIKIVKEVTGLGLTEAKELVENAPKAVKENAAPDEAKELKAKLEEAGAEIELA